MWAQYKTLFSHLFGFIYGFFFFVLNVAAVSQILYSFSVLVISGACSVGDDDESDDDVELLISVELSVFALMEVLFLLSMVSFESLYSDAIIKIKKSTTKNQQIKRRKMIEHNVK